MTTSPLLAASSQIASLFTSLESATDMAQAGREVLRELATLQQISETQPDLDRVIYLVQRFDRPNPPLREAQKALLEMEGRLYGVMARERTLPEALQEQFESLVDGRGEIERGGIERAYRWVREPFVEGLQREMGDRPRGGRAHHTSRTALDLFAPLSELLGREVYLKREDRQPVGSFKIRGAANLLVHERITGRKRQPGAASHGNHA